MRIGELMVISPPGRLSEIFITTVCDQLEQKGDLACYGRMLVNDQLALHLYGVQLNGNIDSVSWDLISPKLLGYIILFDWNEFSSLKKLSTSLDIFSTQFNAPLIIAGCVDNNADIPMPSPFFETSGIPIEKETRFSFCNISEPDSCKKVVATLIDILLEKL
jgi:hypothetical protein